MNFGERLRELRGSMGLTQEQLGYILKVSKANISKYELGRLQPNIETLKLVSEHFKVSIDSLLDNYVDIIESNDSLKSRIDIDKLVEDFNLYIMDDNVSEEKKEYIVRKIQDSYWKAKDLNREKDNNKKHD